MKTETLLLFAVLIGVNAIVVFTGFVLVATVVVFEATLPISVVFTGFVLVVTVVVFEGTVVVVFRGSVPVGPVVVFEGTTPISVLVTFTGSILVTIVAFEGNRTVSVVVVLTAFVLVGTGVVGEEAATVAPVKTIFRMLHRSVVICTRVTDTQ